jgi:hypothetical protein
VDRGNFDNWAEHEILWAHAPPTVELDLPRARSARQLPPRIRAALAARAEAICGQDVVAA